MTRVVGSNQLIYNYETIYEKKNVFRIKNCYSEEIESFYFYYLF